MLQRGIPIVDKRGVMSAIGRAYDWLLHARTHREMLILGIVGACPVLFSFVAGNFHDVKIDRLQDLPPSCVAASVSLPVTFHGMQSSVNWWIFIVVLPLALGLLRKVVRYFVGIEGSLPPLATLVEEGQREGVGARVRGIILSRWVPIIVTAIVLFVAFWDLGDVVPMYFDRSCPQEKDWAGFFLLPGHGPSLEVNALHVAMAYAIQYAAGVLCLMAFGLALVHNVVYLKLIYQRRQIKDPEKSIVLVFDDAECCFGQDALRPAFRIQVLYVVITGLAVSFSRYHNVASAATSKIYLDLQAALADGKGMGALVKVWNVLTDIKIRDVLNDSGQWSLAILFVIVFFVVGLPSVIKFLPFGRKGMITEGDVGLYLAEFMPPGRGSEPTQMNHDDLHKLAGTFARNSFWPASDNVAKRLFAFAFAVLLFVLLPVPLRPMSLVVVYAGIVISSAVTMTTVVFLLYKYILAYVGDALVKVPKD